MASSIDPRLQARLLQAILGRQYRQASRFISDEGADVNYAVDIPSVVGTDPEQHRQKYTPIAAVFGNLLRDNRPARLATYPFIRFLLGRGAVLSLEGVPGDQAYQTQGHFFDFIMDRAYDLARLMVLRAGADVNRALDYEGWNRVERMDDPDDRVSPLMHVLLREDGVRPEDREFVKFLLDQGADIDVIGNWDTATFPIEHAVFYGDLEILLLLIDRGADPTVVHGFLDENSRIRRGTLLDLAIYRLTSSGVFQQGEDRAVTQDRANRQEIVNVVRAIMQGGRLTKSARKREPERPLKRPRAEASLWVWRSVLRASKNDEKQAEQMLARTGLKKPTQ